MQNFSDGGRLEFLEYRQDQVDEFAPVGVLVQEYHLQKYEEDHKKVMAALNPKRVR